MYFDYFKVDKKQFFIKRILLILLFTIVYTLVYLQQQNILMLIGYPIAILAAYKLPYFQLISRKNKRDIINQYAFPTFLRYFVSLIETQGNVYKTLRAIVPYMHEPLKEKVQELVVKLEKDEESQRDAFMEFADYINSSDARMIIGIIYEFHQEGINKNDLKELESVVNELQNNKVNDLIEYKVNGMEKHATPIMIYALAYILGFAGIVMMVYFTSVNSLM